MPQIVASNGWRGGAQAHDCIRDFKTKRASRNFLTSDRQTGLSSTGNTDIVKGSYLGIHKPQEVRPLLAYGLQTFDTVSDYVLEQGSEL